MSLRDQLDLKTRAALVTGAAAGIGRQTALTLAEHNAGGIALVDVDEEGVEETACEIRSTGVAAAVHAVDASDVSAVAEAAALATERLGPIDLLVNTAGNIAASPFLDLGDEEWDETLASHVRSIYATCQALLPEMVARGDGRIVNIGSVAGKRGGGFLGKTAYSAAKAAVNGLTKALAREFAPHGIRVNSVNPGMTESRRLDLLRADPEIFARCLAAVPLGREADPSEIASVILYLLSDASSYVTGETLNVDGGVAME